MTVKSTLLRLLAVAMIVAPVVVVTASPAMADTRCRTSTSTLVQVGTAQIRVTWAPCMNLDKNTGRYWGDRLLSPDNENYIASETVYVRQCDGNGNNCVTTAATHSPPTSVKTASFGHSYRTCASVTFIDGDKFVNYCSPFISYP